MYQIKYHDGRASGQTKKTENMIVSTLSKAVAYLNTDGSSRGFIGLGGSHALETLAGQVAREVELVVPARKARDLGADLVLVHRVVLVVWGLREGPGARREARTLTRTDGRD